MAEETQEKTPFNPARAVLVNSVWGAVLSQAEEHPERKPKLARVGEERLKDFIQKTLYRLEKIEEVAHDHPKKHLIPEDYRDTIAIWDISAPGTYFQASKPDRYQQYKWTEWWDKEGVNHAAWIARLIAEKRAGRILATSPREEWKEILMHAPPIIYNGRPDENKDLRRALELPNVYFPKERVHIIDRDIDRAIDQVKTFELPHGGLEPGDRIAIVCHAQALRLLHMMNKQKERFPDGVKVKVFPLPTPVEGKVRYHLLETAGLVYYVFVSGEAAEEPYPYEL